MIAYRSWDEKRRGRAVGRTILVLAFFSCVAAFFACACLRLCDSFRAHWSRDGTVCKRACVCARQRIFVSGVGEDTLTVRHRHRVLSNLRAPIRTWCSSSRTFEHVSVQKNPTNAARVRMALVAARSPYQRPHPAVHTMTHGFSLMFVA